MSTVKLLVPYPKYNEVIEDIKKSGVKYYPTRRYWTQYRFELDEHPIVSYLILKYDLNTLNSEQPHVY